MSTILSSLLSANFIGATGAAGAVGASGPQGPAGIGNLQEFSTSGTWTKPADASFVMVELWGAGGGGGSGARGAAGTNRTGGSGGGGGSVKTRIFRASELDDSVIVAIGAGGTGGAAQTSDNSEGANATAGGATRFGRYLITHGGGYGGAGRIDGTYSPGGGGGGWNSGGNADTGGEPITPYSTAGATAGYGLGGVGGHGAFKGNSSALDAGLTEFGGAGGGGTYGITSRAGGSSLFGGGGGGRAGGLSSANAATLPSSAGSSNSYSAGTGRSAAASTTFPNIGGNGWFGSGGSGGSVGVVVSNFVAAGSSRAGNACYGNSRFAIVSNVVNGYGGYIATSSNGTSGWTFNICPFGMMSHILHDGSKFVLFDATGKIVCTTTDFSTYTQVEGLNYNILSSVSVIGVKYVNGKYFMFTSQGMLFVSTDLQSWNVVNIPGFENAVYSICWTGTNYVVSGVASPTTQSVKYSSDLVSWSTATGVPAQASGIESDGAGKVSFSTDANTYYSTDHGQSFTVATTSGVVGYKFYINSTWFSVSGNNLWTSTDSITWTKRIDATGDNITGGLAYDGTTLVLGNSSNNTNVAKTATFADLSTWTDRTITSFTPVSENGGDGGIAGGGGGGAGTLNGTTSGKGGNGGNGYARIYTW